MESGAVSLFFPHGIGHMVGLGVRDAGEVLPGREPEPGLPRLRADLPLLPGHVVTIEPGIYFVPALLGDPDTRDPASRPGRTGTGPTGCSASAASGSRTTCWSPRTGHEVLTADILRRPSA